ncbi:DUF1244 domain-containing protein [Pseudomonas mangiferae]|uniref:DUF1244 domain-containing protein n=1 Tax=Pseudomonas mangiferae TaxID=2593654 RepID=A0A553H118_9PSED|nr:DUF1244 domain-containing protein [Pseudomonas mangiferae]
MTDPDRQEHLEAAAFRRLVQHLRERTDVQNIDLMNLAGFCRNCLSKWYKAAADERGIPLDMDEARERIYGMPYSDWKARYQTEASDAQKASFQQGARSRALEDFLLSLRTGAPLFADTLAFVDQHYDYQPGAFHNGEVANAAEQNEGSCKLLGLALLEGFSLEDTLLAFGEHYRSVQGEPHGTDHGNIRALIAHGLDGVRFEQLPLQRKG